MKKGIALIATVVAVFLLSGCGGIAVFPADKSASNVLKSRNNKFIINNVPLDYMVSIVDYKSKFTNNLLHIAVTIQNHKQKQYQLEYKIKWLDDTDFVIESTPWLPLTLNAMDTKVLQQIAHSPQAESFKFYLRVKQ